MRILRGTLAALLAGVALLLLAPTPAYACSCAAGSAAQYVEWADAVFTGTIEDTRRPGSGPIQSSTDPVRYVVHVDQVYKGEIAPVSEVLSAVSGASCGLENIRLGKRYVVFASHHNVTGDPTEEMWAGLCGGTQRAAAAFVADVRKVAGPGRGASQPDGGSSGPPGYSSTLELTFDPPTPVAAELAVAVGLGGAGVLVALTATLWLRYWRS